MAKQTNAQVVQMITQRIKESRDYLEALDDSMDDLMYEQNLHRERVAVLNIGDKEPDEDLLHLLRRTENAEKTLSRLHWNL